MRTRIHGGLTVDGLMGGKTLVTCCHPALFLWLPSCMHFWLHSVLGFVVPLLEGVLTKPHEIGIEPGSGSKVRLPLVGKVTACACRDPIGSGSPSLPKPHQAKIEQHGYTLFHTFLSVIISRRPPWFYTYLQYCQLSSPSGAL